MYSRYFGLMVVKRPTQMVAYSEIPAIKIFKEINSVFLEKVQT